MVIKGKSVAGAARLAKHLERTDTNERMEVKELRGVAAEDLRGALQEMEAVATARPNCQRPFYHASINTRADERMTDAQRMQAIDRLEAELGMTGQPRAVVVHEKKDREHCHIVWTRIDMEKMRTLSDSFNFRKHELVSRELEREFGHERVQGAHIEREGRARPERTPSHRELLQAARTGISPQEAQAHVTKIWQRADTGAAFAKGLEESGWILARGDRRDFVVIDPKGGTHSLARRIEGAKVKDVRARLVDVEISRLPSVADAKATQRARAPQEMARTRPAPTKTRTAGRAARPATPPKGRAPVRIIGGVVRPVRAAGGALNAAAKIADGAASLFESLLGAGSAPKKAEKGAALDDTTRRLDAGAVVPPTDEQERLEREQQSARRARYLQDFNREATPTEEIERLERHHKGRERERDR